MQNRNTYVGNGECADPDSFVYIFINNSFSAQETAILRRTCIWWKRSLSSNPLWKFLFKKDFFPSSDCWDLLNLEFNTHEFYWFNEYMKVLDQIPRPSPLPPEFEQQKKNDVTIDNYLVRDFSFFKYKWHTADYQVHKLAVILSILSVNKYLPKTHSNKTEFVKIGLQDCNIKIPLLQFCYAVLCQKEHLLFTREMLPTEIQHLLKETSSLPEPLEYLFQVAPELEEDEEPHGGLGRIAEHIGICLDVKDTFEPFVYYLKVQGGKYQQEDNTYYWKTFEHGWANAFFNAGYDWTYIGEFYSTFNMEKQCIAVRMDMTQEDSI
mmetsp:Transcript_2055/g.2705  ORF Transcript_2055/g.2705 Transcript_2055/m.2705 type:complete len:322 (-) Transcript_2055:732-1697(-)